MVIVAMRFGYLPLIALLSFEPVGFSQIYAAGEWGYLVEGNAAHIQSYTGPGGDLVIPVNLGGFPVKSVSGFEGNNSIASVSIPHGVAAIGDRAFARCAGHRRG